MSAAFIRANFRLLLFFRGVFSLTLSHSFRLGRTFTNRRFLHLAVAAVISIYRSEMSFSFSLSISCGRTPAKRPARRAYRADRIGPLEDHLLVDLAASARHRRARPLGARRRVDGVGVHRGRERNVRAQVLVPIQRERGLHGRGAAGRMRSRR